MDCRPQTAGAADYGSGLWHAIKVFAQTAQYWVCLHRRNGDIARR
jgi:hypothetical protein